jgi:hypothetical protein
MERLKYLCFPKGDAVMTTLFETPTQQDPEYIAMVASSKALVHRMSVVLNYKEKIEVRRRRDVRRIQDILAERDLDKAPVILRNHLVLMQAYYTSQKVLLPEEESAFNKIKEAARNLGKKGNLGYLTSLAEKFGQKDNFALSLPRCYETTLQVLDIHMKRINDRLNRLPNDEITHAAAEMLQIYAEARNDVQYQLFPLIKEQAEHLDTFSVRLSLEDYYAFMDCYKRELRHNIDMQKKMRVKMNRALQARRQLSRLVRKTLDYKQHHRVAFALFSLAVLGVCLIGGAYVAAGSVFFTGLKLTNLFSNLQTCCDSACEMIDSSETASIILPG